MFNRRTLMAAAASLPSSSPHLSMPRTNRLWFHRQHQRRFGLFGYILPLFKQRPGSMESRRSGHRPGP